MENSLLKKVLPGTIFISILVFGPFFRFEYGIYLRIASIIIPTILSYWLINSLYKKYYVHTELDETLGAIVLGIDAIVLIVLGILEIIKREEVGLSPMMFIFAFLFLLYVYSLKFKKD